MKTTTLIIILSSFSLIASAQNSKTIRGKIANLELKEKESLDKIFNKYNAVNIEDTSFDEIHKLKNNEVSFNIPNVDLPLNFLTFVNSDIVEDKVIPQNYKSKISLLRATNLPEGDMFALSIIDKSISGIYYSQGGDEWIFAPIYHLLGKDFISSKTVVFYKKSYFKDKSKQNCATTTALKQLRSTNVMYNTNNYCRKLYVAIEGDNEWFNFHGFGGYGAMFGIMNNVSNIYSSQLNIHISITNVNLWTDTDPYSDGPIDPNSAVNEFANYWNNNNGSLFRNCALLFSKRLFNNGWVGAANAGSVCGGNAYGMMAYPAEETQVTAHELGHILGHYGHDDNPTGTIMETNITGVSSFSEYSKDQIQNNLANSADNGCIEHGNINMYYNGNYISPYSQSFMCLYNWYNFNAPGNHNISWEIQNNGANAYVVYTNGNNGAVISSGSNDGYFSLKASKSNGCGYIERYYGFYTASCYSYRVYPNPATDLVSIEFEKFENIEDLPDNIELLSENSNIAIKSAKPKEYLKSKQNGNKVEFDVKTLKRGTYYIHIFDEKRKEKPKDIIRIVLI